MLSAMDRTITTIERAFQLAKSSSCISIADIKTRLKAEGYSPEQIDGRVLRGQLATLIKARRMSQPLSAD